MIKVGTEVQHVNGKKGKVLRITNDPPLYEVLVEFKIFWHKEDVTEVTSEPIAAPTADGYYKLTYHDNSFDYIKKSGEFFYVWGSERAYTWKSFPAVATWRRLD